jgi:hypothetical protein
VSYVCLLWRRLLLPSTIITSQITVEEWHDVIGNSTLVDAILDWLAHSAYRLTLARESICKHRNSLTDKRECAQMQFRPALPRELWLSSSVNTQSRLSLSMEREQRAILVDVGWRKKSRS